mmetsp:Transcript_15319/g.22732  ORF Transcript_15319/g.22732 Transcript_15319/m.22732 type:complete len:648 (-) Transcript_15319:72-2015(-)
MTIRVTAADRKHFMTGFAFPLPTITHPLQQKNMEEWADLWVESHAQREEWHLREASLAVDDMPRDFLSCCLVTGDNFHELYANTLLQITKEEPRDFVTVSRRNRDDAFLVYTAGRAWTWTGSQWGRGTDEQNNSRSVFEKWAADLPYPIAKIPETGLNPHITERKMSIIQMSPLKQFGGSKSDVWSAECTDLISIIKPKLDSHAILTNDKPVPRYQMIIDPNQFVRSRKADNETVWVPSEFDVSANGDAVTLVGGSRAHYLDTDLVDSIATPVLSAALPLLAKLKRPALLLEGQRLQVVIKAQRIEVPSRGQEYKTDIKDINNDDDDDDDNDDSDYIGLWHVDGSNEHVVAVILYYYHVDDSLHGGNMEFLDRAPLDVLGYGDCWNNAELYDRTTLREAMRPPNHHQQGEEGYTEKTAGAQQPRIVNCSVPIKAGTMLVFSNYQMIHRVLRIANLSTEHAASRDFVALFVIDPAMPLVPARCHLARPYLFARALSGFVNRKCTIGHKKDRGCGDDDHVNDPLQLDSDSACLILEFLGIVPAPKIRRQIRNKLLRSQLKPRGYVGSSQCVYSTGNGCFSMIGWIDNMLEESSDDGQGYVARTKALNVPPKEVGRGLSETLSIPSDDLNAVLDLETFSYKVTQENLGYR